MHRTGGGKSQYYQKLVDEHAASGISTARFCSERGCAIATFYYWKRRLLSQKRNSGLTFAPVTILGDARGATVRGDIEIRFPGGVTVAGGRDVPAEAIRTVIGSLLERKAQ